MKHGMLVMVLAVCLLLASRHMAHAQLPVVDVANLGQNTITALESVLTTIQTILIEANQILELTPLDDIAVAGGIAEDMALLGEIATQIEGLSYDWSSLQAQINGLFHLSSAPATRDGLTARIQEFKTLKYQCYSYAARTQTLLKTAIRTVDHLTGLLENIAHLIGNMQGNRAPQAQYDIG